MSAIHEGLRKAQKEREARYLKYSGVLAARGSDRNVFGRKPLMLGSSVIILISLAFFAYWWLGMDTTNPLIPDLKGGWKGTRLEKEDLSDLRTIYRKAKDFQKAGRFEDARRLYEDILGSDPGFGDALNNLGVIYIREKNYSAAQGNLEKAIRLKPGYVEAYYNLACLHAIKGEGKEGLVYLKKAIALDETVRDWARTDRDLEGLRGLREFEEILGK
jgi:tetratricopeptide (TPR) repeat protein